ncbi:MAG TPA: sodium:proton exchanger [Eubacterium sp.]|nr:sodium:proton exchanger [Eubacterium sp.]HAZ86898.1 sodium:proton exchanger [Eubacterium sp.]
MNLFLAFAALVAGFVLLVKGADFFVDGAVGIAARFGIPQLVIGLTIAAMGTSMPEAAVSITSALKGSAGITVGNVVGSNIMNILVILGLTAVITPIAVQRSTRRFEIPGMIAVSVLFLVFGYTGGEIVLFEGIIMWLVFIGYLGYLLWIAKNNKAEESDEEDKKWSLPVQLIAIVGGIAAIVLGSDLAVDGATAIAKAFGMSDRIIGLTIVAFGTSLPELVTSVTAARRGKADIAIGNIVGSNIFNILFVAGTTALITPVVFEAKFVVDSIIAIVAAVILLVSVCNKDMKLKRPAGAVMLVCYGVYLAYLIAA